MWVCGQHHTGCFDGGHFSSHLSDALQCSQWIVHMVKNAEVIDDIELPELLEIHGHKIVNLGFDLAVEILMGQIEAALEWLEERGEAPRGMPVMENRS